MKKLALLVLGFLLGFLICYYFFNKTESMTDDEALPPPPKGLIDSKESRSLDQAYNGRYGAVNEYLQELTGEENFQDNRSSWYSLSDLEDYIEIAKAEAANKKYTMDGIRIYLGVKPPDAGMKLGYTTMFIVSTGTLDKSKGSVINTSLILQPSSGDVPGGSGLDYGEIGDPPNANYPQGNN